jgi:hypothetical protein
MMRPLIGWGLAALLLASPASAQQGTTELRGKVIDAQGAILPGVTLTITNQDSGMLRSTTSGPDGTFIASGLVPGTYKLTAALQGFKKVERKDLRLEVGKTASIDVAMTLGSFEETVSVTATSPLVDITSKEIGGNITSETLVQLPSVNGNFIGFVGLLPGIVPSISTESFGADSISVNGQDPRNSNYMLDGGNNNDDVIGQRAGSQARVPIEAVQEFQVISSQYDAEYGRTSGGIINAVTKQGTNQYRGSAFGFFQGASLSTNDYFNEKHGGAKPDTVYQRWGGTIGGPIAKNRIFFFGSLERFLINRPNTINIAARPDLNGTQLTRDRVWNTIVRGDHQVNADTTYGIRWLRETSPQANQIITPPLITPAAAREESDVDQTLSGSLNRVLSNTMVSTLRVTWTRENVAFANACFNGNGRDMTQCPVTLNFQDYVDQQDNTAQARVDDGIQLEETLGWFLPHRRGDHDLKFGGQYEYTNAWNTNQGNMNGTFSFGRSNAAFNAAVASTYPDRFSIRVGGPSTFTERSHYTAFFAQDKWRFNDHVTLSLGLRYELEVLPIPETDDPLVDSYPTDKNNLAPRLGATYTLDKQGVVRAGYGRFYDKTHFEVVTGLYTGTPFTSSFNATFPVSGPDLGPRNGQFPTDPFLVNGPVINQALLNQMFPPGSAIRNTGATWDNPDRRTPYTDELSIGYERELVTDLAVSADYVHSEGKDLLMALNLNPQVRSNPTVASSTLTRVGSATLTEATAELAQKYPGFAPFTAAVTQFVNTGRTHYNALMMQVRKRYSHNYSAQVSYTYGSARGNTSGNGAAGSNFQVRDDMHLERNEGPSDFDTRHNFTFSGTVLVPKTYGLNLSWVFRALSGRPFSLTNGNIDPDLNGIQAEPIAAGTYSGTGEDAYTVKTYKSERNGAYGPGFMSLDMRFGYRIPLQQHRRLELSVDVFNLTNHVNFANPSTGNQASTSFLLLTGYNTSYAPRKAQIGVRFEF